MLGALWSRRWSLPPLLPAVVLAGAALDQRWVTDDGYINFRIVRMVEAGHGPVFNAGERVEAHTSLLWLVALVTGDVVLPLALEWVAVVLGVAGAVAGVVLVTAASTRLWRAAGAEGPLLPAGTVVLAALPPVWHFTTSGLEGGLVFAWIGLLALLLARWAAPTAPTAPAAPAAPIDDEGDGPNDGDAGADARPPFGLGAAAVVGLGPLLRPELAVFSLVALGGVAAVQWRSAAGRWTRLAPWAAAAGLPVAYQVFRMGYYGALIPNTALAKEAGTARWEQGWFYLHNLLGPYVLVVALALVAVTVAVPLVSRALAAGDPRRTVAVLALPAAALLSTLYLVRLGGDYLHGRLLLPSLWGLLAPFAVVPRPARLRSAVTPTLAAVAVWALVCGVVLRAPRSAQGPSGWVVDGRPTLANFVGGDPLSPASQGWGPDSPLVRIDDDLVYVEGTPVDVDPPADLQVPAYAAFGIGLPGYAVGTDVYVLDRVGLADPIASRLHVVRPGQPGHEKLLPDAWLAARLSEGRFDVPLPIPAMVGPLYSSPRGEFDDDADAARRALRCDELAELLDAVREPLTPGRFVDNLLAAPRRTFLDIPPAPPEAVEALC